MRISPRTLAVLGWTVALAACEGNCEDCPDVEPVKSGRYEAVSAGDPKARSAFVHDGVAPKTLIVDRAANTVRIEYDRDGGRVVETWRVTRTGPAHF